MIEYAEWAVVAVLAIALSGHALAADEEAAETEAAAEEAPAPLPQMDDALRARLQKVVVVAGAYEAQQAVTGSYQQQREGGLAGARRGGQIGQIGVVRDIYGVPVGYGMRIRLLEIAGQLFGGANGLTEAEMQRFRDGLTRELANNAEAQLNDDSLATDVFWRVREAPGVQPKILNADKQVPADTDAVIHVGLTGMTIAVDEDRATITTHGLVTVEDSATGKVAYQSNVSYADTDTLKGWSANDYAAWHSYAIYAKHYLAAEIGALLYERKEVPLALQPAPSDGVKADKKDAWRAETRTATPTLAWQLDDSTAGEGFELTGYDIEIFDASRRVFGDSGVTASQYTLPVPLEACKTYHWSVRPHYRVDGKPYVGEWMRREGGQLTANGSAGVQASAATSFLYDFPAIEMHCRLR